MSSISGALTSTDREIRRIIDPLNIGQKMMQQYGIIPADPVPSAAPTVLTSAPTTTAVIDQSAKDAAAAEADRLKKRRSLANTIATSPSGDTSTPTLGGTKLGG